MVVTGSRTSSPTYFQEAAWVWLQNGSFAQHIYGHQILAKAGSLSFESFRQRFAAHVLLFCSLRLIQPGVFQAIEVVRQTSLVCEMMSVEGASKRSVCRSWWIKGGAPAAGSGSPEYFSPQARAYVLPRNCIEDIWVWVKCSGHVKRCCLFFVVWFYRIWGIDIVDQCG